MNKHGITDRDVWNMNETDFRIECERAQMIVTLNPNKPLRMTDSDNRTYLTSVESISSDGADISPMLIISGVHILHKWAVNDLNSNILLETSPTGYSNDDLAMD